MSHLLSKAGLRSFCWGTVKEDAIKHGFGSAEFRNHFRENLVGDRHGRAYAAASFILISAITLTIAFAIPEYSVRFLWLFPIYFFIANLAEYLMHRFPMHHKMPGAGMIYEHVTVHHNFYTDEAYFYEDPRDFYAVILPIHVFCALTVVIWLVTGLIYLISGTSDALFFALVGYGYYLVYELCHFSYHASETSLVKKLPLVRKLSLLHRAHHRTKLMAHYNFNITFPICDRIFKTLYKDPT